MKLRWTGAVSQLGVAQRAQLLARSGPRVERAAGATEATEVESRVAAILSEVRHRGDAALHDYARQFDRVTLKSLEVPREKLEQALTGLNPAVRAGLERAARNIAKAHAAFLPAAVEVETERGVVIGRRPDPLGRVGVYAPGGRAAYPSSVLMGAVPARVAGVGEVILCSPPGPDGLPTDSVLAAAAIAKVDRVFAIGGAGAIAALAFGTDRVPRVDRIVGPGNAYVAEAKRQVAGVVAIDAPAGPSELLAIADETCNPDTVVREMLAQAEHDPDAAVVALCLTPELAQRVEQRLVASTPARAEVVASALASRGAVLSCSLDEGIALSNAFAPEHLLLAVEQPMALLQRIRNAGTVFAGEHASVAFGDYLTGANHVLPTAGAARAWSGLSVQDFLRWTTYQRVTPEAAARLSGDTAVLADAEGLPAHAAAARAWGAR